jgi:hypothetical protein
LEHVDKNLIENVSVPNAIFFNNSATPVKDIKKATVSNQSTSGTGFKKPN